MTSDHLPSDSPGGREQSLLLVNNQERRQLDIQTPAFPSRHLCSVGQGPNPTARGGERQGIGF